MADAFPVVAPGPFSKIYSSMKKNQAASALLVAVAMGVTGCVQDEEDYVPRRQAGFRPPTSAIYSDPTVSVDPAPAPLNPLPDPAPLSGDSLSPGAPGAPVPPSLPPGGGNSPASFQPPNTVSQVPPNFQPPIPTSPAPSESSSPTRTPAKSPATAPSPAPSPSPAPQPSAPSSASKPSAPTPAPTPAPKSGPQVAKRVPGKPNQIYNPYTGAILDVTGLTPGTEVRDPRTGETMLVP